MVQSRLLYEEFEGAHEKTLGEFECGQAGRLVQVQLVQDPSQVVTKSVKGGKMRRWIVSKVYLDTKPSVHIDKWSVTSQVKYTCSAGKCNIGYTYYQIWYHFMRFRFSSFPVCYN